MKTRLLIFTFVLSIMPIIFLTPDVSACLCDGLTVEQRINQADVIFSGTAKDNPWNFSDDSIATGFDVHRVWKGGDVFPLIKNGFVTVSTAKVST
ncbi:MAG: cobalamin biosynthesis protein CbiN, partial [Nitrosopumilus sp.]|nr:cobalamin biosynthesis protein CbiN [Nitrosopumilus sp.]